MIAALKGMDPNAAEVAVSGEKAEKLGRARREGVLATHAKPFTPDDLVAAAEAAAAGG